MPRLNIGKLSVPLPLVWVVALALGVSLGFYSSSTSAQGRPPANPPLPEGAIAYDRLAPDRSSKKADEETRESSDAVTRWAEGRANRAAWQRVAHEAGRSYRARVSEREAGVQGFRERGVK